MKQNSLGTDSVTKLIIRFSVPAIISMLVNAIYNIVDRIFIGQYVGEEALASLIVVFPIMMILFSLCILTGNGGTNLIAISLGRGSKSDANKYFTNMISLSIIIGVVSSFLVYIFRDFILIKLGASGLVLEYASTYLGIYLLFTPLATLSFAFSTSVRAEGYPRLSMTALIISAVTNIILDYIFIGIFGWGVAGGALATGIGQTVGVCIYLYHFINKRGILRFDFKNILPKKDVTKDIVVIGTPSFLTTLGVSCSSLFLNTSLLTYGGVESMTAMAAINSLFTIIIMPINGIQGGVSPIIGFNHGAKLRSRVKETLVKALAVAMSFSTIAFIVIQSVPALLLSMFIDPSSNTMEVAIQGLRIFMLCLPILAINVMSVGYFQATQKPKIAIFLGLLRQFLLLIPLLVILPPQLGLIGVWISIPISDFVATMISGTLILFDFKRTGKGTEEEITDSEMESAVA